MAGFWTGLVHGTLMCAATLAALSLAFPRGDARPAATGDRPEAFAPVVPPVSAPAAPAGTVVSRPDATQDGAPATGIAPSAPGFRPGAGQGAVLGGEEEVAAVGLPRDGSGPAQGTGMPDAGPLPEGEGSAQDAAARPALQPLPDPVGSDFRRGSDDPPRAPAALPARPQGEAPRSLAAGPEPAPAPAAIPADTPRVLVAPAAPAGIGLPAAPEPLDRPQMEAPVMPGQPARIVGAEQDTRPRPSRPVMATADLGGAPADAGGGAAALEGDEATGAVKAAAVPAKDQDSAPETPGETADRMAADRQSFVPPEAPASSAPAGLALPDAAPEAQALAASPLGTETPPQPSGVSEDRSAAIDTLPRRAPAPAATPLAADPRLLSAGKRAPRPAPDLSIPQAFAARGASRAAPALPQPAGTTPPAPDLSDLNPGASR